MTEYIKKQAALDIVNGWRDQLIPTYGKNDEYVKCLETVAEHLESLHAADVRPVVRGEWIVKTDSEGKTYGVCSCCGYEQYAGHLKYCPECGGKMDGPNQ